MRRTIRNLWTQNTDAPQIVVCVLPCVRVVCCEKKTCVCYATKYPPLLPLPPRPLLLLSFVFRPSYFILRSFLHQVLDEAGADGTIKNGEGFAASVGIEGKIDPANFLPALTDAANVAEVKVALQGLIGQGDAVDRGEKGMAIMKLRKAGFRGDPEVEALIKQAM